MASHEAGFPDYPVQNAYTRDLRAAAAERGDTGLMSLWSGQGARLVWPVPAGELVGRTVAETERILGGG